MATMRDVFWDRVYELAKEDENIVIVSADMGAPSLDKFKKDFPHRYISTGIAEQNAILIASGMAKLGFKPYVYAIAPFITMRCLEQIRVNQGMMKLPITIVGVGGGFGYEDSGATHHLLEDIGILKSITGINIYIPFDNPSTVYAANTTWVEQECSYVRLDREEVKECCEQRNGKNFIITTGNMWKVAKQISEELPDINLGFISCFHLKNSWCDVEGLKCNGKIFTVEEGFEGGLYSSIKELFPNAINLGIKSSQGYCYKYGGREEIRKYYGIDKESLKQKILSYTDAINDNC